MRKRTKITGQENRISCPVFCFFGVISMVHKAPRVLCRFGLLLQSSVGVGARGEVSQHTADGFDIDPVFRCKGGERVPQIVKANVRAAQNVMDGSPQMFERSRNCKLV